MNNEELLEQFGKLIKPLSDGQERIEKTQQQQGTAIAHIKTGVEALAAGQKDLCEQVGRLQAGQKAIRSEMATKADIQDVDAKLVERVNSHEKRIDDLEKEAGLPNPHKN